MNTFLKLTRAMVCAGTLAGFATATFAAADFILPRDLDTRTDTACAGETAFGDFVADAVRKTHGADIALVSCASIRGNRTFAKGDSFNPQAAGAEIAADATLVQIDINGSQLLDALESAVAALPATSPTFVQLAGVRMEVDVKKAAGQRIVKLTSNGAALDLAKTYRIAATEDVVKALAPLAAAPRVEGQAAPLVADVVAHLQATGVRDIKVLGRIKIRN